MKTLDEVIDNFEKACDLERRCEGCSGCLGQEAGCPNDGAECVPDALHYLKEYQKIEDEYEELKDWWAEENAENVPLTWDELKQMEGKPVWFVYDWNNVHYKGWILLDHMEGIFIIDAKDNWALSEVNMDKWKAYREEHQRKDCERME